MKKLILGIALFIIAISAVRFNSSGFVATAPTPSPTGAVVGEQTEKLKEVSVFLIFGDDNIATYSATNAATVFDALDQITKNNNIPLSVKEYSFGKMVESIGNETNSTDNAWIFYVNGKSADKGADQFKLSDGDIIEWKYTKPIY